MSTTANSKLADLEERCEYAQEVLGRPPSWLVRWGKTVVFIVLVVFAWLGWIVRYPDVVPARIVLATLSPPVPIIAPVAGNIGRLRVHEQQAIAAGDLIVTIDNAANTDAVLRLRDWIRETRNLPAPAQALARRVAHERLELGDLQADFAALQRAYDEREFGVELRAPDRDRARVLAERAQHERLLADQQRQADTIEHELTLLDVDFARNKELQARQLVPMKAVEDKERELLQLRRSVAANDADRTQTQIRIAELDRTLEQLGITEQRDSAQTSMSLIAAYQKLLGSVDEWDKRYALRAPQAGRISFTKSASERRFVNQNEEVATLVPDGGHAIVGRLALPEQNSGRVKIGQRVYIRLDGFPFQEYGTIEGRVKQIALVPRDGRYAIDVELPQQMTTTFRRQVELRQEMQGDAGVVTENLRVIQRLFHQFRKASAG